MSNASNLPLPTICYTYFQSMKNDANIMMLPLILWSRGPWNGVAT